MNKRVDASPSEPLVPLWVGAPSQHKPQLRPPPLVSLPPPRVEEGGSAIWWNDDAAMPSAGQCHDED